MKKVLLAMSIAIVFSIVLSGCFMGPGFQVVTSGAGVEGNVYGVANNATVTIRDDLGEFTTTGPEYVSHYYQLSVKPGVRTLTYSCSGYATVSTKVSVIGQITLDITLVPVGAGDALR